MRIILIISKFLNIAYRVTKTPITNIIFKIRYNSIKKPYNTTYESWTQFY